jgi:hypothetical protein
MAISTKKKNSSKTKSKSRSKSRSRSKKNKTKKNMRGGSVGEMSQVKEAIKFYSAKPLGYSAVKAPIFPGKLKNTSSTGFQTSKVKPRIASEGFTKWHS